MKQLQILKSTLALTLMLAAPLALAANHENPPRPADLAGHYNLHLYFGDSAPFLDELTLRVRPVFLPTDELMGHMHVPNDFDAPITLVETGDRRIVFDVLVPRNAARPKDLLFRYETQFMPEDPTKATGFVRLVAEGNDAGELTSIEPSYVGSFLLFRTAQDPRP